MMFTGVFDQLAQVLAAHTRSNPWLVRIAIANAFTYLYENKEYIRSPPIYAPIHDFEAMQRHAARALVLLAGAIDDQPIDAESVRREIVAAFIAAGGPTRTVTRVVMTPVPHADANFIHAWAREVGASVTSQALDAHCDALTVDVPDGTPVPAWIAEAARLTAPTPGHPTPGHPAPGGPPTEAAPGSQFPINPLIGS